MRTAFLLLSLGCLLPATSHAVVHEFTPVRDTTIYSDADLANGSGTGMFAGGNGRGTLRRGLIAFDLSSIGPGFEVVGAELQMTVLRSANDETTVSLHRVLANWGEGVSDAGDPGGAGTSAASGDATWNFRFFGTPSAWNTPGGDFAGAASTSRTVQGEATYVWEGQPAMLEDIQNWIDAPETNFGWIVLGDESLRTARRFGTREASAEFRPRLRIDVVPVPEASTYLTMLAGLVVLGISRRRFRPR